VAWLLECCIRFILLVPWIKYEPSFLANNGRYIINIAFFVGLAGFISFAETIHKSIHIFCVIHPFDPSCSWDGDNLRDSCDTQINYGEIPQSEYYLDSSHGGYMFLNISKNSEYTSCAQQLPSSTTSYFVLQYDISFSNDDSVAILRNNKNGPYVEQFKGQMKIGDNLEFYAGSDYHWNYNKTNIGAKDPVVGDLAIRIHAHGGTVKIAWMGNETSNANISSSTNELLVIGYDAKDATNKAYIVDLSGNGYQL